MEGHSIHGRPLPSGFGFFVGQVMRAMKGKSNPALANELLKKKIGE